MSKSKKTNWFVLIVFSSIAAFTWFKLSYSQISFVDLSVGKKEAILIAEQQLASQGVSPSMYLRSVTFDSDDTTNRFLQKTIGFTKMIVFLKTHNIDLFYWNVRFFKKGTKEEFILSISSKTGRVIHFNHVIEETASRPLVEKEAALQTAKTFLNNNFNIDSARYTLKEDNLEKRDNRTDYSFTFEKSDARVIWQERESEPATGKLLTYINVSSEDILSYSLHYFEIPDSFKRFLTKQQNTGQNLTLVVSVIFVLLIGTSVFLVASRKNHFAMHKTKRFYIRLTGIVVVISILSFLNEFEFVLAAYNTASDFESHIWRALLGNSVQALFTGVMLLMPALAGEGLRLEVFKNNARGSFLHFIRSTFASRSVAGDIVIGYFIAILLLGIQAVLIKAGELYCGVWVEHNLTTMLSSSYLPFVAALAIGTQAAFSEELTFRLFGLSWFKKIFKSTAIAILVSSLIWGFAHSNYPVFPMWFRGVEVSILGIFFAIFYLRFGLITVITAHFLFDVFWHTSAYLFGQASNFDVVTSYIILGVPLILAAIAFLINKKEEIKQLTWDLNIHQLFNLDVLRSYLAKHKGEYEGDDLESIKDRIVHHGWDYAVVDVAVNEIFNSVISDKG